MFAFHSLPGFSSRSLRAHPARMLMAAAVLSLGAASAFAAGVSDARNPSAATCDAPEFPSRWQDEGDSGTVTLAVLVGENGQVMASRLLSSSGIARVDRASLKASATCRFQPAVKDNQSMPAWTRVQYHWVVE